MNTINHGRIQTVLVWLLLFSLCLSVFGCANVQTYIANAGKDSGVPSVVIESFLFRESAFECGSEQVSTKVLAIVSDSCNTDGLKLIAVCDETGDTIELNDEGVGADTIANDHKFYGEAFFQSAEEKKLTYYLRANDGRNVLSQNTTVTFYTASTYLLEEEQIKVLAEELDNCRAAFDGVEKTDAAKRSAAYLETVENMKAYLEKQIQGGMIVSYEWEVPYFFIHLPTGGFVYSFEESDDETDAGEGTDTDDATESDAEAPALLMLPYYG